MILENRLSIKKRSSATAMGTQPDSEKPPPYTKDAEGSSHPPESSSTRRRVPPLPALPVSATSSSRFAESTHSERKPDGRRLPPPHVPTSSASSSGFSETPTAVERETASSIVNQINLVSKSEPIIGTFSVDPRIPVPIQKKKVKKGKLPFTPHATFRTTSGAVQLVLGTSGNVRETPKSHISVSTGSGNIDIELLPISPLRPRVGLDVRSQHGNINVHLPETFCGLIQLDTRKGELHLLPALAQMAKVLKATDKEIIVLVGTKNAGMWSDEYSFTDLCQLSSKAGKVVVGITGKDKLQEKAGFWSKVGEFFRG